MKKKLFFVSVSILSIVVSCKSKSENNYLKAAKEELDSMSNPKNKNMNAGKEDYNLYVPNGWTTAHWTYAGINYYTLSAPKTEADPNTNVNVITEYMQNLNLDVYKQKTIESIKKGIPSSFITGEGDIETDSLKGGWYSYNMEPAGVKASIVAYIFPKDGIAYIITAGTQQQDANRYRSTFDSIAKSFKFHE